MLARAHACISVLFPFYNIHRTLVSLKKQQLSKIEEQYQLLRQRLDRVADDASLEVNERAMTIVARVMSLQLKEKLSEQHQNGLWM